MKDQKRNFSSILTWLGVIFGGFVLNIFLFSATPALAWTIGADFESGTVGSKAQGTSGFTAAGTATLYSNEKSFSGTKSAKMTWSQGVEGFGVDHGEFQYPSSVASEKEVWSRGYFYFATPWNWSCSPVIKILRGVHVSNSSGSNVGYLSVFSDSAGNILLSNEPGDAQPSTGVKFDVNSWQSIEMYVKLSRTDPIFRIWKNGVLIYEDSNTPTISASTDRADLAYIMTNWNGGAPQAQVQYLDDFVITTDRPSQVDSQGNYMIGPIGGSTVTPPITTNRPAAPRGLAVL